MSAEPHDPYCPVSSTTITDCPLCAILKAARDAERDVYQKAWKANLPHIERRNYLEGWTDGAAHHAPRCP